MDGNLKAGRTTVGRLVRVLQAMNDEWGGGPRMTLKSDGSVYLSAWDSEREVEVHEHFADALAAVKFCEKAVEDEQPYNKKL